MKARPMRILVGVLALACVFPVLAGCQGPAAALKTQSQSAANPAPKFACPDGKTVQPGLTAFGAYIGTWQANHQRLAQTPDYAFVLTSGWVDVRCSATNYVVEEVISLKFPVPSGRALQFALTDLPADSKEIYDHTRNGCRALQYQSRSLGSQLAKDDRAGLVDVTVGTPTGKPVAALEVVIDVGAIRDDDSRACN
jgi:hypothetical protein